MDDLRMIPLELTILMPCLNEAETLARCIDKARQFLSQSGVEGEVLIADNGSTDGSQSIAWEHGARVVAIERKGYGVGAARGDRVGARPVRDHGRQRRQLRFLAGWTNVRGASCAPASCW